MYIKIKCDFNFVRIVKFKIYYIYAFFPMTYTRNWRFKICFLFCIYVIEQLKEEKIKLPKKKHLTCLPLKKRWKPAYQPPPAAELPVPQEENLSSKAELLLPNPLPALLLPPPASPTSSSNPLKRSSSTCTSGIRRSSSLSFTASGDISRAMLSALSSSSSPFSPALLFTSAAVPSGAETVVVEVEQEAVADAAALWTVDSFFRVLPAREFRWVGLGCVWSPVYVTMKTLGSKLLRSTCFLAEHPFELLHL